MIIHHYYINKEKFPGYRSAFSFKDIALSEQLLDTADLKLISGHLHAPFLFKNYLCTGSLWATSPLEINQLKGLWKWNQGQLSFYGQQLLNYIELEPEFAVSDQQIQQQYSDTIEQLKKNLSSSHFPMGEFVVPDLDLKKTVLTLKVKQLDYEQIDEVLAPELRSQLSDFRLKKASAQVKDLLSQLERPDEHQLQTFGGWKELLKAFLQKQYPEDYPKYEELLKELKVL